MAQIRELGLPAQLMSSTGDLTEDETSELTSYMQIANTNSKNIEDMSGFTENAMYLFFEQRRRTRAWVIGCSVAAGSLGVLMGYFAGKRSEKR